MHSLPLGSIGAVEGVAEFVGQVRQDLEEGSGEQQEDDDRNGHIYLGHCNEHSEQHA